MDNYMSSEWLSSNYGTIENRAKHRIKELAKMLYSKDEYIRSLLYKIDSTIPSDIVDDLKKSKLKIDELELKIKHDIRSNLEVNAKKDREIGILRDLNNLLSAGNDHLLSKLERYQVLLHQVKNDINKFERKEKRK